MGCDIHIVIEVRWPDARYRGSTSPRSWDYVAGERGMGSTPVTNRCYSTFSPFGVRQDKEDATAPFANRGLPADASAQAREDMRSVDLHSHTYATLAELIEWSWKSPWCDYWKEALSHACFFGPPEHVRFLIAFDN